MSQSPYRGDGQKGMRGVLELMRHPIVVMGIWGSGEVVYVKLPKSNSQSLSSTQVISLPEAPNQPPGSTQTLYTIKSGLWYIIRATRESCCVCVF